MSGWPHHCLWSSGRQLPSGSGTVDLDDVVEALQANPVYVDAQAERALTDDEIADLRAAIRDAGTPIYIAVLPASAADLAGGDAGGGGQRDRRIGRPGRHVRRRRRGQFPCRK